MSTVDVAQRAHRRRSRSWESSVLAALEWVSNPALAGVAFLLLSVGVVTWLPALAATAQALYSWRSDGEQRCFIGTLTAFPAQWRRLWRHSVVSTLVTVLLVTNVVFLVNQQSAAALILLALHAGIGLALLVYHLALAATPGASRRETMVLAFGGWRPLLLLTATGATILLTLPLAVGPFLFGATVPLLVALHLADRLRKSAAGH